MKNPREPIAMNPTTRLLLLPTAPGASATCLQVDGAGRVLSRTVIDPAAPPAPTANESPARQILAMPGSECLSTWLDLPARNPLQAVAAARVLLAEQIAGPVDTLHLAIAPATNDGNCLVVAVETTTMQASGSCSRRRRTSPRLAPISVMLISRWGACRTASPAMPRGSPPNNGVPPSVTWAAMQLTMTNASMCGASARSSCSANDSSSTWPIFASRR